jgi:hypothetical protein
MTSHHHATINGYTAHGQLKTRSLQDHTDYADTVAILEGFADGLDLEADVKGILTHKQHRMKKAAHLFRAAMEALQPLAEEPNP